MKRIYLLLLATLLWLQPAAALMHYTWKPVQMRHRSAKEMAASGIRHFLHINPDDRFIDNSSGIFALVAAGFGIAAFIVLGITATPAFLVPVFVGAIAATIAGAVGIKRHKPIYAILGLTLGLLEIVGGIIALALLL